MMVLAKHASGKALQNDNLEIAARAKQAKKADPSVIDATSGMFYHEGNVFSGFRTVEKVLNALSAEEFYAYSSSDGGYHFKEAVLNWVFSDFREEIEAENTLQVVATPGGTGAIFSAAFLGLDPGERILFPRLCWAPYYGIAANLGLIPETFEFFSEEGVNIKGLQEKAERIAKEQGKLVLIINDPCNNPTGYTLSEEELGDIIAFLGSLENPCLFIYDIAYLDFAFSDPLKARKSFQILSKAPENVLSGIAFSASKSFSVYGQRLGALIVMGRNGKAVSEFYEAAKFNARHTWSNANKGLISLMVMLDRNPELKKEHLAEVREVLATIQKRAGIFLEEAREIGLKTFPYRSGFFITIPVNNADGALAALVEDDIYLLPTADSIRLAVCSLSEGELKGLGGRIKKKISRFQ